MVREALQCRPGTAGTVHKGRNEETALGHCLPPAAGGSDVPQHEGTVELPHGPCSPSAVTSMLGPVLGDTVTNTHCVKCDIFLILLSKTRYSNK